MPSEENGFREVTGSERAAVFALRDIVFGNGSTITVGPVAPEKAVRGTYPYELRDQDGKVVGYADAGVAERRRLRQAAPPDEQFRQEYLGEWPGSSEPAFPPKAVEKVTDAAGNVGYVVPHPFGYLPTGQHIVAPAEPQYADPCESMADAHYVVTDKAG